MNLNRDPEAVMAAWLDDGPTELPSETRQAIAVSIRTVPRRRPGLNWPFVNRGFLRPHLDVRRLSVALGAIAVVAVVGAIFVLNLRQNFMAPAATLPTSPADWSRVLVDPEAEGQRVESLAAGPRGLLATVGEGPESRLYFSADGRNWTRVIDAQVRPVGKALVATDPGFLLVGNEVLASEDGLSWRRLAGPGAAPDFLEGAPFAAAVGGPGFVAVGSDNKAWYSSDGTDWTLADVPPPPGDRATDGIVELHGVAAAGPNLIAWGRTETFVPVFYTSTDGLSWTNTVPSRAWDYPMAAGGPNGFLLAGEDGPIWLSADGKSWERVAGNVFGTSGTANEKFINSITVGDAGYVAVGADTDGCMIRCSWSETVIWTSVDGRSWSRVPSAELFGGSSSGQLAEGSVAAAWGDQFVVGGSYDNKPAVWISASGPAQ